MTKLSREEMAKLMRCAMARLEEFDPRTRSELLESEGWIKYVLYRPDPSLFKRLQDYFDWRSGNHDEDAGALMEEIALLIFKGLMGWGSIRSFQSYAPQHDLVVDGSSAAWEILMMYLHLPRDGRSIVIEAKNQNQKISDQQFSRLCGILQNKFTDTAHLGVFVSRTTASGFPEPCHNMPDASGSRVRSLRYARATQALFHSKTGKYVIVIDECDLQMIANGVALPKILEAKIRELEAATGLALSFDEDWREVDLPSHLSRYV